MPTPDTPITGPGLIWSPPPGTAPSVVVPFTQWWLVVPEAPTLSIPVRRVQSGTSGLSSGAAASYTVDAPVPTGIFQAFERETAIIMHGKRQGKRFDLNILFEGEAEFAGFETLWNETLDNGYRVLVQSDQTAQWWADLGATRPATVVSAKDRTTRPIYIVALACVQIDPPA